MFTVMDQDRYCGAVEIGHCNITMKEAKQISSEPERFTATQLIEPANKVRWNTNLSKEIYGLCKTHAKVKRECYRIIRVLLVSFKQFFISAFCRPLTWTQLLADSPETGLHSDQGYKHCGRQDERRATY